MMVMISNRRKCDDDGDHDYEEKGGKEEIPANNDSVIVSIPPLPSQNPTQIGHRNGVKVIGTIITEWEEGKKINTTLLERPRFFAQKLVDICVYYGFDGYLVNIEADVGCQAGNTSKSILPMLVFNHHYSLSSLSKMVNFVVELKNALHKSLGHSLVIWYDSIDPRDGKVRYQNVLNEVNKPFFDACDGILTNYFWKKGDPHKSNQVANERRFDVYSGIDVFGRGSFGGGKFNSHIALEEVKRGGTSVCLFAPGWTYEVFSAKQEGVDFSENLFPEFSMKDLQMMISLPDDDAKMTNTKRKSQKNSISCSTSKEGEERWRVTKKGGQGFSISRDNQGAAAFGFVSQVEGNKGGGGGAGEWRMISHRVYYVIAGGKIWWICSHQWSERQITVPIWNTTTMKKGCSYPHKTAPPVMLKVIVEVEVKGKGPNFSDLYRVKWDLLDAKKSMISSFDSGEIILNKDSKIIRHVFHHQHYFCCKSNYDEEDSKDDKSTVIGYPAFIRWTDSGKDAERWAGNYGACIGRCTITVLLEGNALQCPSVQDFKNVVYYKYSEPRVSSWMAKDKYG
eukprot:jgi/Bigna1/81569/fgenesh1_pg.81_\